MLELRKNCFINVEKIFKPVAFNLLVESVLHDNTHGRVWADNPDKPKTAVLWTTMTDMIFCGQIDTDFLAEFRQELTNKIVPKMQQMQIPFLVIYYPDEKWKKALQKMLAEYTIKHIKRYNYKFSKFNKKFVNSKYTIQRLTPDFAENKPQNWQQVMGWIYSFWTDLDDFYKNGIGFFIKQDNAIASWCLSVYKGVGKYELGLATAPEFQKKGMATQVAGHTIEYCCDHNIAPLWQCNVSNIASVKLAQKLGYSVERDYYVIQTDL